jgi:hypothetical protein
MAGHFVGVTVMPEFYQHESIAGVLDNLTDVAAVTSVTTSPYVMEPVADGEGQREPPIDAGAGKVRLLDRPLWGRRELWVRTAPSFTPEASLYRGCSYQPPEPCSLTDESGELVGLFLDQARERGLKTYLQVQAAIPPGYRVQFGKPYREDLPRMPDKSAPGDRVAANACLAAPELHAYQRALIRDLLRAYPQVHGIRFDWPEYPPYELDSIFMDFSPHVAPIAEELGMDFTQIQADVLEVYRFLHAKLTDLNVEEFLKSWEKGVSPIAPPLAETFEKHHPVLWDLVRLKRALSGRLLKGFRKAMDDAGRPDVELVAHAFPPPWSDLSGIDFAGSGDVVDHFCVKLYGMHWLMMIRSYAEQLLGCNRELGEHSILQVLYYLFDMSSESPPPVLEDVRYPSPGDPHPGDAEVRKRKIAIAQRQAGDTPVIALEHGYGPVDDFSKRINTAYQASDSRIWVNRYCYLNDEKLTMIGGLSGQEGRLRE